MAVAYVQEFAIVDGDTSTENYDAVVAAMGLEKAPDGLVAHTAGFDHEKGVFRIFDVWESRQAGEQWMEAVLNPVLEQAMSGASDPASFTPPTADYWYELHHSIS
jgi:hypothetical protein